MKILLLGLLLGMGLNAAAPDIKTVCASGCNFTGTQAAVNAVMAAMNSTCDHVGIVLLRAGETHQGSTINLGSKTCAQQFILQTDAYRSLPNRRITPADAPLLAKIAIPIDSIAITLGCFMPGAAGCVTTPAVRNVLIRGIEIEAISNSQANNVGINAGEHASIIDNHYVDVGRWELLPSNVTIDQVYIHGAPGILMQSAVRANGTNMRVTRSYFDDIIYPNDSQAVAAPATRGLLIENNYMSVSGESVIIGGTGPNGRSVPPVTGERNSLTVRGNYSLKNPKLYLRTEAVNPTSSPCYEGSYWQNTGTTQWWRCLSAVWTMSSPPPFTPGQPLMKNHFELKDGSGVFIGNSVEGGWVQAQQGQCFHVVVSGDILPNAFAEASIVGNRCLGTGGFITGLGGRAIWGFVNGIDAHDNLATGMWHPDTGGGTVSHVMVSLNVHKQYILRNNTMQSANPGPIFIISDDSELRGETGYFTDNAIGNSAYTIFGSAAYDSICLLNFQFTGPTVVRNNAATGAGKTIGGTCGTSRDRAPIPHPNWLTGVINPATEADLWTNPTAGDWTIKPSLTQAIGTAVNGKNVGADISFVQAMTANSKTGAADPPRFAVKSAVKSGNDLIVHFTAPTTAACAVTASAAENFSSSSGTVSQTRIGLAGVATVSGLARGRWFVRVSCGPFFDDVKGLL